MKTINRNIYPKDGYFFVESDGSRLFGDTWSGVIARVAAYRARAKLPPGDPANEVINQACVRNPGICHDTSDVTVQQTLRVSLKGRVLKWMNSQRQIPQDARRFVSEELRRARVAICAGCPKNEPLPGGCASCKAALKELRAEVIGKRPVDGRLNACSVLGEDLGSSSNLDLIAVEDGALPGNCWRKKTI